MKALNERDLQLIARIRGGETEAFDELVAPYRKKLCNLIRRVVHDPSDSEDIMQDALLRAYRSLDGFRGDSCFYTWMFRISLNCAFAFVTRRRRLQLSGNDTGAEFRSDVEILSDCEDPANIMAGKQMAETVNAAIDAMRPEFRTAILMHQCDGLSYLEIADAMLCPVGTVRSRISGARQVIASRLRRNGFPLDGM
jgi:RNA polymerase sigma-70 factor, ECF subfamily